MHHKNKIKELVSCSFWWLMLRLEFVLYWVNCYGVQDFCSVDICILIFKQSFNLHAVLGPRISILYTNSTKLYVFRTENQGGER